jgi:hypothetical protein
MSPPVLSPGGVLPSAAWRSPSGLGRLWPAAGRLAVMTDPLADSRSATRARPPPASRPAQRQDHRTRARSQSRGDIIRRRTCAQFAVQIAGLPTACFVIRCGRPPEAHNVRRGRHAVRGPGAGRVPCRVSDSGTGTAAGQPGQVAAGGRAGWPRAAVCPNRLPTGRWPVGNLWCRAPVELGATPSVARQPGWCR